MAKLKPSEFRLMLIFAILAFAFVNFYGYQLLRKRHNDVKNQREELRSKLEQAENLALQEDDSLHKQAWLGKRVPVYRSEDEMKTFLLKFVEQRAATFSLTPEVQPQEPSPEGGYMRSRLEVKDLIGSIETIVEFIFSLQDPEEFRAITSLELKAKPKDPKTVICELVIEQWWNIDSLSIVANSAAAGVPVPEGVAPSSPASPTPAPAPAPAPSPAPTPDNPSVPGIPGLPAGAGSGSADGGATAAVVPPPAPTPNPTPAPVPVPPPGDGDSKPISNPSSSEDSNPRVVLPPDADRPGSDDA